jgi:hypothetical protein
MYSGLCQSGDIKTAIIGKSTAHAAAKAQKSAQKMLYDSITPDTAPHGHMATGSRRRLHCKIATARRQKMINGGTETAQ